MPQPGVTPRALREEVAEAWEGMEGERLWMLIVGVIAAVVAVVVAVVGGMGEDALLRLLFRLSWLTSLAFSAVEETLFTGLSAAAVVGGCAEDSFSLLAELFPLVVFCVNL